MWIHYCGLLFTLLASEFIPCFGAYDSYTDQPFASLSYTAVVKGKAALPCHVKSAIPDDSVALLLWYKDDALAPIYTMDARKGTIEQARTLIAPLLQGRAFFNLNNRPAFLQIDPVDISDAGDYRCRVDFRKARTINTVVSLKVIVPPEEPQISLSSSTSSGQMGLKALIGPFNEGDSLKLTCSTIGGKPRPSLTWWRDTTLIDDTFEYVDKDLTTNQLVIPSLARHHLLAKLTCQAVNNNMTVPLSTSATLDLNLKPTEIHINQLSPILVANKEATFECKTIGSRPKPNIFWTFGGKKHNLPITGDQVVISRFTVLLRKEYNRKKLICTSENPEIANSAITHTHQMDVQYLPQVTLELGNPTISLPTIQEGNDIYFDCKIDSNPPPNKPIIWKHNDERLPPQAGVIQSNQSLVLQKVSRFQRGKYQCLVTNSQGTSESNEINLDIRFAPVCKYHGMLVYGALLNEAVILRCEVMANPDNVSFLWRFRDQDEQIPGSFQSKDKTSELKYIVNSEQDYGIVQCSGKNDVGIQRSSCKFNIKPPEPPDFPYNCQISNQSDNTLVVLCLYQAQHNNNSGGVGGENDIFDSSQVNSQLEDNSRNSMDALKMLPSLYVYPITFYFAEVYTKSDSQLVSNVSTFLNLSSIFLNTPKLPPPSSSSSPKSSISMSRLPSSSHKTRFSSSAVSGKKVSTSSNRDGNKSSSSRSDLIQSFRDFELFIPNLESSTSFRIKLYAINTRGRSDDLWLEGSTLRAAEKLIDSMADSSLVRHVDSSSFGSASGVTGSSGQFFSIRGPKLLLAMLIGGVTTIFLIIFLGIVAILRLRRNILHGSSSGSSSSSLSSMSRDAAKRSNGQRDVLSTLTHQHHHTHHQTGGDGISVNANGDRCLQHGDEDEDEYCCENGVNMMDHEVLLSSSTNQSHTPNQSNKGPPDIISFGYRLVAENDKQYLSYEYPNDSENQQQQQQQSSALHPTYAQIAFPMGSNTVKMAYTAGSDERSVEYAKIDFEKAARVNVIATGSPKFESTV
ncbi:uncharacterized protein LOC141857110 [Brevipalpus obovatus]|uniref:uncharacterized protein LOC141857110 n=1 Tax=Brevipalpus obovatus TaxID=246614 RepID=UPI003D9F9957